MVKLRRKYSEYLGLSTDVKPTGVVVGSFFYERDTNKTYITYDGDNWVIYNTAFWQNVPLGSNIVTPSINIKEIDDSVGGVELIASNENRIEIIIQNTGTKPALIRLGGDPSSTAYHFVISSDTVIRGGDGGILNFNYWNGSIKAICDEGNSTKLVITEFSI